MRHKERTRRTRAGIKKTQSAKPLYALFTATGYGFVRRLRTNWYLRNVVIIAA
jgi:hypothetical protein